ncbi:MAG TPA: FkbM family methyltransferase [Tepidisphaeraceae bacterium]|jgi:FkbM family methyltransferase|nr:FkbM family methyltransferase [Tepidisphaeraceae bacterium]
MSEANSKQSIPSDLRIAVVDVGAFGGVARPWASIGGAVDAIAFEPSPGECQRLNALGCPFVNSIRFYPHAVAGDSGAKQLYVTRSATCCSLAEPNAAEFARYGVPGSPRQNRAQVTGVLQVQTVSLDGFCDRNNLAPDFVKLDTQGTEYDILANGFIRHIHDLVGVEIEVEFVELYRGQRLFADVDQFLRANGFALMGLKRHHWKMHDGKGCTRAHGGRLIFGDALYLNRRALARCEFDYAVKASLIMRRYDLHDVAEHLQAIHQIDAEELAGKMKQWDRTAKLPSIADAPAHADRGVIVEFDDDYGF